MIPILGNLSIALALVSAAAMAFLGLRGKTERAGRILRAISQAQVMALALAFAALISVFVTSDFSVAVVAKNSSLIKPLFYKITGAWGNHEGSILLWALISAGYTSLFAAYAASRSDFRLYCVTLGVLGAVNTGLFAYVLLLSSPFAPTLGPIPVEGNGLNPLLQDFGIAIHPPMLYLGYVGLVVPYAASVASLLLGTPSRQFANLAKPFTYLPTAFLTMGIILGAWWAYRELGWGGWWFWDPVENASLIPWLLAASLAHSLMALGTRGSLSRWSQFLAIAAFGSSVLGAFLVRSGVLVSVHAFAADPRRGIAILAYLVLVLGGSLIVFALKAKSAEKGPDYRLLSREGTILGHNLFGLTAALSVLLGTLYPVIIQALNLPLLSVGAPYFEAVTIPLMVSALAVMALASAVTWRGTAPRAVIRALAVPAIFGAISFALLLILTLSGRSQMGITGQACIASSVFLIAAVSLQMRAERRKVRAGVMKRARGPMLLAHFAVGVFALAAALSSVFSVVGSKAITPGESVKVGHLTATLVDLKEGRGPNFLRVVSTLKIERKGAQDITLFPEFRYYPTSDMPTSEAAIHSTLLGDTHVTLNAVERSDSDVQRWAVRVQYRPFLIWVWIGTALCAAGLFWAAIDAFKAVPKLRTENEPIVNTAAKVVP